jgi:hypothetical protein
MRSVFLTVLVTIAIAALLPPVFTRGACTAEFDAVGAMLEQARPQLLTLASAQQYLASHALAFQMLSAERCESSPPPDVVSCPSGPLLLGAVPVRNRICRFYRDPSVRFQLGFNPRSQLIAIQTDMNPYRIMKMQALGLEIDLAK